MGKKVTTVGLCAISTGTSTVIRDGEAFALGFVVPCMVLLSGDAKDRNGLSQITTAYKVRVCYQRRVTLS